jgi:hypothetical protein
MQFNPRGYTLVCLVGYSLLHRLLRAPLCCTPTAAEDEDDGAYRRLNSRNASAVA